MNTSPKKTRKLDKWLKTDKNMLNWVINQSSKRNVHYYSPNNQRLIRLGEEAGKDEIKLYRELIFKTLNEMSQESLGGYTFLKDLRQAWSMKRFGEDKSKVTTSFTLNKRTFQKLSTLARGTTKRQIIEYLIDDLYEFKKKLKAEQETAIERRTKQIEPITELNLNNKIKILKHQNLFQKYTIQSLLEEIIRYETLTMANGLKVNEVSPAELEVKNEASRRLNKITRGTLQEAKLKTAEEDSPDNPSK